MTGFHWTTRFPAELSDNILNTCLSDAFQQVRDKQRAVRFCRLMFKLASLNQDFFEHIYALHSSYDDVTSARLAAVSLKRNAAPDGTELYNTLQQRYDRATIVKDIMKNAYRRFTRIWSWKSLRKLGIYPELAHITDITKWDKARIALDEARLEAMVQKRKLPPGAEFDAYSEEDGHDNKQPSAKRQRLT